MLPRVRLLAFGGTIASVPRSGTGAVEPALAAAEIVAAVPALAGVADLELQDFPPVASYEVTPAHMLMLAREVEKARADGVDGVVVTHGTDTIEETAYALALMLERTGPVALTGAMRNPSLTAPDGPANLLAAVRVAAGEAARELGPVVVLNDEVHAARLVTKSHTSKVSTFVSEGGPAGGVTEDRVAIWWRPAWADAVGLPDDVDGTRVELVRVVAGMSDTLIRAATASKPAGIVIEGTGGGHVPQALLPALQEAIDGGIPVVVGSRTGAGETFAHTYRMPGAELDLAERGAILAGRLAGPKARLRLLFGVAAGRDPRALFPVG